jgi:hypothetical protein
MTDDTTFFRSISSGVWTSFDYTGTVSSLSHIANKGNVLYGVETSVGSVVYQSTDGGVTWVSRSTGSGFAHEEIAVCDSGRILALHNTGAQWNAMYSDDDGASWVLGGTAITAPNLANELRCKGGRAYVATNTAPFVRYSTDEGVTWNNPTTAPPANIIGLNSTANGQTVIAFHGTAPITEERSTDGGVNFTTEDTSNSGTFSGAFPYENSFILGFRNAGNCVFSSSTAGGTGTYTQTSTACSAGATLLDGVGNTSSGGQDIIFGGSDSGSPLIAASRDGGATWALETLPSGGSATEVRATLYVENLP